LRTVDVEEFLSRAETTPIIDVRSPAEYAHGHIPDAINVPLFEDDERAEIGTLYKQTGRQVAILRGLEIAGTKMKALAERGIAIAAGTNADSRSMVSGTHAGQPRILVHCWRGGMRSRSMGWLLEQTGIDVVLLAGGYRAYRHSGHERFAQPLNLVVLGGLTGSGKTLQLQQLADAGEQVIDLEALANHRGSAFGGVGLGEQPTVEQFENRLQQCLRQLDMDRRIWIEAESQSIGRTFIPLPFFRQAVVAPMIVTAVPLRRRVELLTAEYSRFSADELIASVEKIRKRLGGQNVQRAIEAIRTNAYEECVEICLAYYDKSYGGSKLFGERSLIREIDVPEPDDIEIMVATSGA
jgi:tRNA 2-selenouridine synthase